MEKFGDVESCKLEVDEAGNSKGYGYVYFSDEKASEAAKLNLVYLFFYFRTVKSLMENNLI